MGDKALPLLEGMATSHPYLVLFVVSLPSATAAITALVQVMDKVSQIITTWRNK